MLLATALWQFAISLHVPKGIAIAEALRTAEANPHLVDEWAYQRGLRWTRDVKPAMETLENGAASWSLGPPSI